MTDPDITRTASQDPLHADALSPNTSLTPTATTTARSTADSKAAASSSFPPSTAPRPPDISLHEDPSCNTPSSSSRPPDPLGPEAADSDGRGRISWHGLDLTDHLYTTDFSAGAAGSLDDHLQHQNYAPGNPQRAKMAGDRQQDDLAVAQNGGSDIVEDDTDDGDDGLDDDMMDKISSSPSIEDGGYTQEGDHSSSLSLTPSTPSPTTPADAGDHPHAANCRVAPAPAHQNAAPIQVSRGMQTGEACEVCEVGKELPQGEHKRLRNDRLQNTNEILPMCDSKTIPEHDASASPSCATRAICKAKDGCQGNCGLGIRGQGGNGATNAGHADDEAVKDVKDVEADETDSTLMVPYEHADDAYDGYDSDDGDYDNVQEDLLFPPIDDEFVDYGWDREGLHDAEDIDFEFVYALHTFVATVEGQANATKGDTMVLLDDSNSYWWLVRVVKDSSIGYLPAEHIETPTERLARLNKHRNIDLSATMLGDQSDKSKNPLRTAIRRRKKNVTFAAPTYVDYSEIEYSTDEEDLEAEYFADQKQDASASQKEEDKKADDRADEDETAKVEPLKPRAAKENGSSADAGKDGSEGDVSGESKAGQRTSEEIFVSTKPDTLGPTKTKDGTVRDSFFKDDTVETKKITLTPNLLRDDSAPRSSSDSKELKQRPSLDRVDKDINNLLVKDDKKKKDKREEKKKPGAFRSLFSRKDRKRNEFDDDEGSNGKQSLDEDKDLEDGDDDRTSTSTTASPQRQTSKLQKQNPLGRSTDSSPTRKGSISSSQRENGPISLRLVASGHGRDSSSESSAANSPIVRTSAKSTPLSTITQGEEVKPQKLKKAKVRAMLDDFDSDSDDAADKANMQQQQQQQQQQRQRQEQARGGKSGMASQEADRAVNGAAAAAGQAERLSESPVQVSPVHSNNPPALMGDTSSQEEDRSSPVSSPSPELVEAEDGSPAHRAQDSITTSTSTTTASATTWNDSSLRAFFDSGSDIRDLLVVVYDKSDVVPAGPDHPVVGPLFREQNAKLAEITTQLDNMLGDWLARKQRVRGAM